MGISYFQFTAALAAFYLLKNYKPGIPAVVFTKTTAG